VSHDHAHHRHSHAPANPRSAGGPPRGVEHAGHAHVHGQVDPGLVSTERGIRAVRWSLVGLLATGLIQLAIAVVSGSVALLADVLHNFADAATAIPLWIAFAMARRRPSRRFPYGYGRVEDLAGAAIVLIILATAALVGYESLQRLRHPQPVFFLGAVAAAAVVGFLGNEAVAWYRTKVGREIGSAALVADGYHAHADGLVSLAVLVGAAGVWLGFPFADPLVGLGITLAILWLGWESARAVARRMLDGVEPEVLDHAADAAGGVAGVHEVTEVRARWVGHRLHLEVNVAVDGQLPVAAGHAIAKEVRHRIQHDLPHVRAVTVHVDPAGESGEGFHRIDGHDHDGLPTHSHP
jgi:cation diffusion facilitator family transporter